MPLASSRIANALSRHLVNFNMRAKRRASRSAGKSEEPDSVKPKRQKKSTAQNISKLHEQLLGQFSRQAAAEPVCPLPTRQHSLAYHRPLLLNSTTGPDAQTSLLEWFDGVSTLRSMPWRKPWIDPTKIKPCDLRPTLERRAYQVWISEIMLQQTRVAVVIEYWKRWMDKWPTIHDLAAASSDDVLAAWRGLGYYSRATRIHEAAKRVVDDPLMQGLLPEDVKSLQAEVPGVGRYTAGAISSIVFGRPEPMVDGNVLRVLSRQLGLMGDVKSDKTVIDILWATADALVKDVAQASKSDRPGQWGQGLMELGSTVCTPTPNCTACPITTTCRAYMEGKGIGELQDIEDLCSVCEPMPVDTAVKQSTLTSFAFSAESKPSRSREAIINHAKKFPLKTAKKVVREQQTLVCAVRRGDGKYLIHRRPDKGLLAGLWEFPSQIVEENDSVKREEQARSYVSSILGTTEAEHVGELGSVPWLFSHLKLTMHVHFFEAINLSNISTDDSTRWTEHPGEESMGTGMRKCWSIVQSTLE